MTKLLNPTTTSRAMKASKKQTVRPVEIILARLRDFYDLGQGSLDKWPERMGYSCMEAEAKAATRHPEMLRKARQFASSYSMAELEQLGSLCGVHGHALGLSHVIKLITVGNKRDREAFQLKALKGRWGVAQLEAEILKRFGSRRSGVGRRRLPAADELDACFQIARMSDRWGRFSQSLRVSAGAEVEAEHTGVLGDLTPAVRKGVGEADRVMRELGKVAANRLKHRTKKQGLAKVPAPRKQGPPRQAKPRRGLGHGK